MQIEIIAISKMITKQTTKNVSSVMPKIRLSKLTSTRGRGVVGATVDNVGTVFTEPENGTKPIRRFVWS